MRIGAMAVMLVVAAATFGAGYFVGAQAPPHPVDDFDEAMAADQGPTTSERALLQGSEHTPGAASLAPRDESTMERALASVLRAAPQPAMDRGTMTLSGHVRTADGTPVGGVTVTAAPGRRYDGGPRPVERSGLAFKERMTVMVQSHQWVQANRHTTTSSADGSFSFTDLLDADYYVRGELEHWQFRCDEGYRVRSGGEANLTAKRNVRLTLTVTKPDGAAAGLTVVRLARGGAAKTKYWRRHDRVIDMAPGTYQLTAESGESGEYVSEPQEVVLVDGSHATANVALIARPVVLATVDYEGTQPVGGTVYMLPVPHGETPNVDVLRGRGVGRQLSNPGQNQTLYKDGLGDASVAVAFERGGRIEALQVIRPRGGKNEVALNIAPIATDRFVRVRVLDAEGELVRLAKIRAGYGGDIRGHPLPRVGRMGTDGTYFVLLSDAALDLAAAKPYLSIWSKKHGGVKVKIDRVNGQTIEVQLKASATVMVSLSNLPALAPDETVQVVASNTVTGFPTTAKADVSGKAVLTGMQPGTLVLRVEIKKGRRRSWIHRERITVRSGEQVANVKVAPVYSVTIRGASIALRVSRKRAKAKQHMDHSTPYFDHSIPIKDGEGTAHRLPAGRYFARSKDKVLAFTVPEDREVTFPAD